MARKRFHLKVFFLGQNFPGSFPVHTKRVRGNRVKADQLRETEAETLIAPCHNCHSGLEGIIKGYELNMDIKFLSVIIYQCMEGTQE